MSDIDLPASPPRPTILVILTPSDPAQLALLELLHKQLSDRYALTAATDTGQEVDLLPILCIGKNGPDYMRKIRMADVLIMLQPGARITRYDPQQLCIAVTDYASYCAKGLQIKQMALSDGVAQSRDWTGHAMGYVYNAPFDQTCHVDPLLVTFACADAPATFADSILTTIDQWMGEDPQLRTRIFCFLDPIAKLIHMPADVADFLRAAQESREIQFSVITSATPTDLLQAGFAFGQMISPTQFKELISPDNLRAGDIVIYNDFSQLVKAGILSHLPVFIYDENLRLLSAREELNIAALHELAADPGGFHKASLDTLYDKLDVARQRVSIIVPHYNTDADKLERCLRSALECRLCHENVEIILVDDGSKEDIEPELAARLGERWGDIQYFRKDNEGLGLTRNYGIRQSTGDYIFFLDSDDEIVSENLKYMLTHAIHTGAGLTIGKRILCDAEGNFLSDSLDYIFRAVSRQITPSSVNIYDDSMANNKLVRKLDIIKGDLWFRAGYYEDNLFSARAYGYFKRIECLNLRIHNWYQYGENESITKTRSPQHINDKLASLTDAWTYLPDSGRRVRIKYNLNHDIPLFLKMAMQGERLDYVQAFDRARNYVLERMYYIDPKTLSAQGKALLAAFEQRKLFPQKKNLQVSHNTEMERWVFFPRTHFHLLQAITHTLACKTEAIVVLTNNLPGFNKDFIDRIRMCGVFSEVLTYGNNSIAMGLNAKLALGSGSASKIFDNLFRSIDNSLPNLLETDIGVSFNDGLPERYYISRKFHKVIKMEDGYGSTSREFTLDYAAGLWGIKSAKVGVWGPLNIFIQKEYNRLHATRRPVSEIHVSAAVDPALLTGDYAQTKVVHRDFKDLVAQHRTAFLEAMATLYGRVPDLEPDATIILTQPLFFDYCTREENLAVVAHLISLARHKKVYLKPHPMDPADYSVLDVHILPARVPFEYLEAKGGTIDEAITFGSSALVNSGLVRTTRNLFPFEGFTHADVVAEIDRICYDLGAMDLPDTKRLLERHAHPLPKPAPDNAAPAPLPVTASAKLRRKVATALRLLRRDRVEFARQLRSNLGLAPEEAATQ